MITAECLN